MSWVAGGAIAIAAIFAGAAFFSPSTSTTATDVKFVLVMPFATVGAGVDDAYLELGMAEALTARLGRLGALKVAPAAAIRKSEDPFDAGRRMGVDAVLTGSIQRVGNRLRVSAQLSTPARRVVWGDQFNEQATEIFALQDQIAERLASSLVRGISSHDRAALRRRESVSSEAYGLYMRAREQWSRRSPAAVRLAIQMYTQAIAIDSNFALAYAGLADAYNITRSGLPTAVRYPLAKAAAERALSLDENLAEAQTARAFQHYKFEWKWEEAEMRFRRAIQLNPSYALAHLWYAECLFLEGKDTASIAEYRKALALDPFSVSTHHDMIRPLLRAGSVAEARAMAEAGMKLEPRNGRLMQKYADVLLAEGKEAESVEMRLNGQLADGEPPDEVEGFRLAYRTGGMSAYNAKTVERLKPLAEKGERLASSHLAQTYGRMGDRERTLYWLRRAIANREDAAIQLRSHPSFDFLKGDRTFDSLLVLVGFPKSAK